MEQQRITQQKNLKIKSLLSHAKPKRVVMGLAAVMFVLVFALDSGTGTAGSWTQYPETFTPYSDASQDGLSFIGTDCNSNKGCISVVKFAPAGLGCSATYCGDPRNPYHPGFNTNFYFNGSWSGATAVCIAARSQITTSGTSNTVWWALYMKDGTPGGSGAWTIPQSKTYANYCSFFKLSPGTHNGELQVRHHTSDGSWVYVSSASLRW